MAITEAEKRTAMEAALTSEFFVSLERLSAFLRYIVDEELAGRGDAIRAKTIAQDVYGKVPGKGRDSDNVVRVDARRLRQTLGRYHDSTDPPVPVRIRVDTGGYRPRFERSEPTSTALLGRSGLILPFFTFLAGTAVGVLLSLLFLGDRDGGVDLSGDVHTRRTLERQAILDKSPAALQAVNLAEQARLMLFPIFDPPRQKLVSELFLRVIELDPDFFGGYAGAAQTLSTLAILTPPGPERDSLLAHADEMSLEAVRLGPTEGWAQSASAWSEFANRNYDEALRLGRRGRDLAPDDADLNDIMGSIALFSGRFQEAVEGSERVRGMAGLNQRIANLNILGAASFHLGDYETTLDVFNVTADSGGPVSAPSFAYRAAALSELGRTSEARRMVEDLTAAWPNADLQAMLRQIYRNPAHADQILTPLAELGWHRPPAPN